MKKDLNNLQSVQFIEHPIVDFSQKEPSDFDITASDLDFPPSFIHKGSFHMKGYNHALILKILTLPMLDIPDFLVYQCTQVKDPVYWLNQLEMLITFNYGSLSDSEHLPVIHKLFVNIQFLRLEIKTRRNSCYLFPGKEKEDKFNLESIISDLSLLTAPEEKKAYLISLRADILEKNVLQPQSIIEYIDIEFEKIEKLDKLGSHCSIQKSSIMAKPSEKMIINGSINVLVDVFFQFLNEYRPLGRPYLDYSASRIADFISNSFLCSDGKIIPVSTILTILSPGKTDKRPSKDKRINLRPDDL